MMNASTMSRFFDAYPEFYGTSQTGATPERLNARHEFIIERNRAVLDGARVVDLASHDGRWSFAALKAGATHVLGIEPRGELVEQSRATMEKHGIPETVASFMQSDALAGMRSLPDGYCDTVMCLGFFYHTLEHGPLLEQMARIARRAMIFDTAVTPDADAVIRIERVDARPEWNAVQMGAIAGTALEGRPSRKALEMLIEQFGFSPAYLNWLDGSVPSWSGVEDYATRNRVTLVAVRKAAI